MKHWTASQERLINVFSSTPITIMSQPPFSAKASTILEVFELTDWQNSLALVCVFGRELASQLICNLFSQLCNLCF